MEFGPTGLVAGKITNIEPFTLRNIPPQFFAIETCLFFSGDPPTSANVSPDKPVASYFLVAYLSTGYYMVHQFTYI